MSLLEKLSERQHKVDFEKTADDIFLAAVCDELDKLGYEHISPEMLKEAGLGTALLKGGIKGIKSVGGAVKGVFKKKLSPKLQDLQKLQKNRIAGKASQKAFNTLQAKPIGRGTLRDAAGRIGKS